MSHSITAIQNGKDISHLSRGAFNPLNKVIYLALDTMLAYHEKLTADGVVALIEKHDMMVDPPLRRMGVSGNKWRVRSFISPPPDSYDIDLWRAVALARIAMEPA